MKNNWWPVFEKMLFVDGITYEQVNNFAILFCSQLSLNMLAAGNMTGEVG